MKQFRITTASLTPQSDNDCHLSPDDPIWDLLPASQMGGMGSEDLLAKYRAKQLPQVKTDDKGKIARELGLEPGTEAWFKHWFGRQQ
jgi:hypothetical protein